MTFVPPPEFPRLTETNHSIASPQTWEYNCIAYAAGDMKNWWWPTAHWPEGISKEIKIESFDAAFGTLGYVRCADLVENDEYEQVALFVDKDDVPTHAARRTRDGRWVSKLGPNFDIVHELKALEGPAYGTVRVLYRRPWPEKL